MKWHSSGPTLITVMELIIYSGMVMTAAVTFAFTRSAMNIERAAHHIKLPQTFSHKDNIVGNVTDLPPFNGLIIKNDGQIKIE